MALQRRFFVRTNVAERAGHPSVLLLFRLMIHTTDCLLMPGVCCLVSIHARHFYRSPSYPYLLCHAEESFRHSEPYALRCSLLWMLPITAGGESVFTPSPPEESWSLHPSSPTKFSRATFILDRHPCIQVSCMSTARLNSRGQGSSSTPTVHRWFSVTTHTRGTRFVSVFGWQKNVPALMSVVCVMACEDG